MVESLTDREREKIIRIYLINKYIKGLSHTRNPVRYSDAHLVALTQIVDDENELFFGLDEVLVAIARLLGCGGCEVVEVVELVSFCT